MKSTERHTSPESIPPATSAPIPAADPESSPFSDWLQKRYRALCDYWISPRSLPFKALIFVLLWRSNGSAGPPSNPAATAGLAALPLARTGVEARGTLGSWDTPPIPICPDCGLSQSLTPWTSALPNIFWALLFDVIASLALIVLGVGAVRWAAAAFGAAATLPAADSWRQQLRQRMARLQGWAMALLTLGVFARLTEDASLYALVLRWDGMESTPTAVLDAPAHLAWWSFWVQVVGFVLVAAYVVYAWALSPAFTLFRDGAGGVTRVLRRCSACCLLVLAASVALWLPDQSQEALRVLFEDTARTADGHLAFLALGRVFLFWVAALAVALTAWFWARQLLFLTLDEPTDAPDGLILAQRTAEQWVPRFCAVIPLCCFAVALCQAAAPLLTAGMNALPNPVDEIARRAIEATGRLMIGNAVLMAVAAVIVGAFVWLQPDLKDLRAFQDVRKLYERKAAAWREQPAAPQRRPRRSVGEMSRGTHATLLIFLFVYAGITLCLWAGSFRWASYIGPTAILLFAFAGWIPPVCILTYCGWQTRFPFLGVLLAAAFVYSYLDLHDNHRVRDLAPPNATATAPDTGLHEQTLPVVFSDWLQSRSDWPQYQEAGQRYPVILICAEGGGIRAAYQAAITLATLQAQNRLFAEHVFAISGVSGGSVGAATFAALVAKADAEQRQGKPVTPDWWTEKTASILSHDLLSPTLAALLYGESLQTFVPYPMPCVDRARALERGLEGAWQATFPDDPSTMNPFDRPFYEMAHGFTEPNSRHIPALLLNTTHVETGDRMVVSTIPLCSELKPGTVQKLSAAERTEKAGAAYAFSSSQCAPTTLYDENPYLSPRLSTAAFLSARFPYISPSASLPIRQEGIFLDHEWLFDTKAYIGKKRYLDGGIYENSGAATLADVVEAIRDTHPLENEKTDVPYRLIVLRVGYGYDPEPAGQITRPSGDFDEVFSPIATLFNARDGRARTAVSRLSAVIQAMRQKEIYFYEYPQDYPDAYVGLSDFLDLRLRQGHVPFPLGWLLSRPAQEDLKNQVNGMQLCISRPAQEAEAQGWVPGMRRALDSAYEIVPMRMMDYVADVLALPARATRVPASRVASPNAPSQPAPPPGHGSAETMRSPKILSPEVQQVVRP